MFRFINESGGSSDSEKLKEHPREPIPRGQGHHNALFTSLPESLRDNPRADRKSVSSPFRFRVGDKGAGEQVRVLAEHEGQKHPTEWDL